MTLLRRYRSYNLPSATHKSLLDAARQHLGSEIDGIEAEFCFYIETSRDLRNEELRILDWLLTETFEPYRYGLASFLDDRLGEILEVGPRMTFTTAWSTNAVSICHACGLGAARRIERSRRYLLRTQDPISDEILRGSYADNVKIVVTLKVEDEAADDDDDDEENKHLFFEGAGQRGAEEPQDLQEVQEVQEGT